MLYILKILETGHYFSCLVKKTVETHALPCRKLDLFWKLYQFLEKNRDKPTPILQIIHRMPEI